MSEMTTMIEQTYDIIFRGDIVLGQQLKEVKLRLQQLFKTDAAKIDGLFSGKPVPLKRNLDLISAQKYRDALIKAGAQVELILSPDANLTSAPTIKTTEVIKVAVPPPSLHIPAPPALKEEMAGNWSLAPVGAQLLPIEERSVVVPNSIDISALSLRKEGGNLLDVNERKSLTTASVVAPNFKLADVGANLVSAEEKLPLPLVEIEISDWDIAELGADMIDADEKEMIPSPIINSLDVGLAPAGADLGQIKLPIKPVTPNISGLQLVDQ
jgi:hypothetical protein